MYFALGATSPLNIYKFYYDDPNQRSVVLSGEASFIITNDYQYSSYTSVTASVSTDIPTMVDYDPAISTTSNFNQFSNDTNDIVYIGGEEQTHYIQSGTNQDITFDYFCSRSGASITTGIYDIVSDYNISSWLSTSTDYTYLTADAPTVTSDTIYTYGIYYYEGTNNITASNFLTVYVCNISNCASCEYSTRDTACTTCDTGYSLSSDNSSCTEDELIEDETVEALATTSKAVAGTTAAVSAATSLSSVSSSSSGQSIWALVNQYQLIILLPMLGTYLENDFEFYITEFQLVSFDFDFMNFIKFPFFDSEIGHIDYSQPDKIFEDNGVESGSFIYNQYNFIKIMLIVIIIDLIFMGIKYLIVKWRPNWTR